MKKQFLFHIYIAVLLLIGPWMGSPVLALTWDINTIDSNGFVGKETSIALDANDNPHISYVDSSNLALKYAAFNGSTWDIETIDGTGELGSITDISIAIDAEGHPHISYHDDTNDYLKYAAFNGSIWDINTIDSTGIVGWDTSIALDAND